MLDEEDSGRCQKPLYRLFNVLLSAIAHSAGWLVILPSERACDPRSDWIKGLLRTLFVLKAKRFENTFLEERLLIKHSAAFDTGDDKPISPLHLVSYAPIGVFRTTGFRLVDLVQALVQ